MTYKDDIFFYYFFSSIYFNYLSILWIRVDNFWIFFEQKNTYLLIRQIVDETGLKNFYRTYL